MLARQLEVEKSLISFLAAASKNEALPPKNQREIRKSLAQAIEDSDLAKRLVKVGIYDCQHFQEIFNDLPKVERKDKLQRIECYTHLGKSLRNIRSCAERITELVNSLRSYARARIEKCLTLLMCIEVWRIPCSCSGTPSRMFGSKEITSNYHLYSVLSEN